MDLQADLVASCAPAELFGWVDDLSRYPQWLEIVTRAEPLGDDAWAVDLRGRLGPLARTKRLRMVRQIHEAPSRVVFGREEVDTRTHSDWRLTVDVTPDPAGARLDMCLHYGGGLLQPIIERVLRDEIERSRLRLVGLVEQTAG